MARDVATRPAAAANVIVGAGIGAGIIGGTVMAVFEMAYTGMATGDFLIPLRLIGATFYGPEALVGGPGVLLWGMIVHFATSAVLGIIFAWIVGPDVSGRAALGWGILYGIVVLFVLTYLVMPWSNPTMYARVPTVFGAWAIGHVLYGICAGLAPSFMRRLARSG